MPHTPGPWEVHDKRDGHPRIFSKDAELTGNVVCLAPRMLDESMSYWKANARLIAAAPDLLAACKGLLAICEMHGVLEGLGGYRGIDTARAAIARAEGGDA